MPYRVLNLEEVSDYLHLSLAEVEQLARNQEIPCEKRGKRLVFRKIEVEAWASQRILGLEGRQLKEYEQKSAKAAEEFATSGAFMPELICPDFINPALPAKTKASVLREMTELATSTGRVSGESELLEDLLAREALCSTGVPGGLALMHARVADSGLFTSPFIALGRTVQQIPFGAPDGRPTDLFFLVGCPSDRLHLQTLARLCLMAQTTDLLMDLRHRAHAEGMWQAILSAEETALEKRAKSR